MPDYIEYSYELDGILISRFSPSKLNEIDGILCEGHPHAGDGCCQFFYYRQYTSHAHFLECYMRMVRHPGSDYLDFYWLTNALPKDRIDPYTIWYCDRCEGEDTMPEVLRYKCVSCKDVDICVKCFCDINEMCPKCEKRVTWMGHSDWTRRSVLLFYYSNSTNA
jgi:hypothetical protein